MSRKRTPQEIETAVLKKCARRCALCFGLSHDVSEKRGQIAHLDQDPSNYSEDNLAYMCMDHHSLYDSKTSQHKNYTIREVKAMRGELHGAIARKEHAAQATHAPIQGTRLRTDETRFFAQIKALPETDLIKRIWRDRHWRIRICPTTFLDAQFRDLDDCQRFMRTRRVECPSSVPYPNMLPDADFIVDSSLQAIRYELDVGAENDPRNERCECWALFRSGQFVYNGVLPRHKELPTSIHYLEILRVISHVFEFSSRMSVEDVLSPEAVILISLRNVEGLSLFVPDRPATYCKSQSVDLCQQVSPEDLKARSPDLAREMVLQFYAVFGWKDPNPEEMSQEQRRFVRI